MDLGLALPNGPGSTFQIGDGEITAMELNQRASGRRHFPYPTVEDLVDDLKEVSRKRGTRRSAIRRPRPVTDSTAWAVPLDGSTRRPILCT